MLSEETKINANLQTIDSRLVNTTKFELKDSITLAGKDNSHGVTTIVPENNLKTSNHEPKTNNHEFLDEHRALEANIKAVVNQMNNDKETDENACFEESFDYSEDDEEVRDGDQPALLSILTEFKRQRK